MSNTANNLPLVPGNWRSGNDAIIYAPSNYARSRSSEAQAPGNYVWGRPYAAPRTLSYNQGFVREEDMTNSTNNRSAVTERRRSGSNSDARIHNYNNLNRFQPPAPRPHPSRQHEISGGQDDPWRLFEDRVRTGPYGLDGFPLHPLSPMRIVVLRDENAPQVNPRLRQFIQESPPRIRGQWNMQLASEEDESSRLTREEQDRALKKLKKQVYNPYPKSRNKNWRLYYRDTSSFRKMEEEQDDDGKSCAICLEDFVPKQEVLVTPCNHMFHESCIVRWVKSNGQCPVCRFVIGEQRRETPLLLNNNNNNNNNTNLAANDLMAVDLISLIRAMEEAFEWVHVPQ
ncbi:E3 ubiquitin-protein ligase [Thalictrum thalictroides]|uniref:E3 ubiquitin-protein ligase n=1 Tax=Thalictrum thalictroides TaxID=46969 RepID=A0A7J6W269_THATH|nr:E3 ubiquitin-protein ligase [Thalictrum thalictroides]